MKLRAPMATIIFAPAETGGRKGPVLMKPVSLGGWVQSQPQMEARPPAGIVSHSCGCSSSPILTAAWPLASEAADVFACLCPLMYWAKAISGRHVLQTDQQSRKCPFSLPQLDGWGWVGRGSVSASPQPLEPTSWMPRAHMEVPTSSPACGLT